MPYIRHSSATTCSQAMHYKLHAHSLANAQLCMCGLVQVAALQPS
jgi:hypothetical protein